MRVLILDEHAQQYRQALLERFPRLQIVATREKAQAVALSREVKALFVLAPRIDEDLVRDAARLGWIQALTSGTEGIEKLRTLPARTLVTSTRGVQGPQMAEMAILHMMSLSRDVRRMMQNVDAHRWDRWRQPLLWGTTVVILGIGAIAQQLAARCKCFGMQVVGVTSLVRPVENFDQVYGRPALNVALAQADFVVVLLAHDAATHNLIDARALAAMRKDAYLINLSRGGIVDEQALINALRSQQIAGAGLDVFAQEPLPAPHPLWDMPSVFLTPHLGGMSDVYPQQIMPILLHNMHCYIEGATDQMLNRVR